MRRFNTTGLCVPRKHYMVDISKRVARIRAMVDDGDYFCINRGRQYGKTTTIYALGRALADDYVVVSLDFQALSQADYATEATFVRGLSAVVLEFIPYDALPSATAESLSVLAEGRDIDATIGDLFRVIARWCALSERPLVLIIDEVDSACNNQVFLDFLARLRLQHLAREANPRTPAFQSVILAGVTDVRHLRAKIRDEDQHKVNSPWNIAVPFLEDMDLSEQGIAGMLADYEADHATGMDVTSIARQLRAYTHGYPFLVSRLCQILDQELVGDGFADLAEAWTERGVDEAVRRVLSETNTLFDSLFGKLANHRELAEDLRALLLCGEDVPYAPDNDSQQLLLMYGFVRVEHNRLLVANRIFEMRLYVFFVAQERVGGDLRRDASADRQLFITPDGGLDVPRIMEHFIEAHNRIHGNADEHFLEAEARERFLTYLSTIVNGTGTYSIEEQTRDQRRMDVVVHWLGWRYVIELKIWRGERYHEEGERQVVGYLDYFGLDTGYLLSFDFRRTKEPGVRRVDVDGRTLWEGTV